MLVFVDECGGDLPVSDLAEKTVGHVRLHSDREQDQCVARPVAEGQAAGLRGAWALAVLLLLSALGAGCNSLAQPKGKDLHGIVKSFHHDLRWRYNEDACARVDPQYASDYREKLEDMDKDLNITAWSVRKVEVDEQAGEARLRINLVYYLMPSTVVKDENVKETWKMLGDVWVLMRLEGGPVPFPPEGVDDDTDKDKDEGKAPAGSDRGQDPADANPVRDLPAPADGR